MKTFLFFLFIPVFIFCQNTIALPDITNYSKQTYLGGLQNWDIKQDKNSIIYIANNEGLLTFDGKFWKLYALPNKTIVRSVEIGNDNRIYVGGQDEVGYFQPNLNGELIFHSLNKLIPKKHNSFGDVWDIVIANKEVFFRSDNKIFRYSNSNISVFTTSSQWTFMGICNGILYAHENGNGIMFFKNNIWQPISINSELPKSDPITSIIRISSDSVLITTLKNGVFLFLTNKIIKLNNSSNKIFENQRIYSATKINNNWVALATSNGGLFIIDKTGNIIQSFSKKEGLQNNNILSVFFDNQSNLWLGLDNGIDFIKYNSAIKQINPLYQDASGYAALIKNDILYLGTSNGVYFVKLHSLDDLSFSRGDFQPISTIKGQSWSLTEINNQVLLGHHEGAFVIKDFIAKKISTLPGFWNFIPTSGVYPTSEIIAGNYKGVKIFKFENNQFVATSVIQDFIESSRFLAIDADDNIWISHPYHGLCKMVKQCNGVYNKIYYSNNYGLPSKLNNYIYKIKNEVIVATEKGIYEYDSEKNLFKPSLFYKKLIGEKSIRYIKEDASGNIWFIHEKKLGVIDFTSNEPYIIYIPELDNKLLGGFEFIYPINNYNIILGGEKGFYHLNYKKYKEIIPNLKLQIRGVKICSNKDSLIFGGYSKDFNEIQELNYGWKTIHFEYSAKVFGYENSLEYSYKLIGFDNNWSNWTKQTLKEYTNLSEGKYTFEVKVRNNFGNESEIASYSLIILPPWYLNIWFKLLYSFLLIFTIFRIYRWQQKKFKRERQKHFEEQKKIQYIHDLELNKNEKEFIALTNEKLKSEIDFKNSELASSAMHLVKKGELISTIKTGLSNIIKSFGNPQATAEIKKLLKSLVDDENVDKEWEAFSKHFNLVHNDFLTALKLKHPNITSTELKLSAYLNMNLSTKEIAQLMNISVRGVEISRYRLRKKLQLNSDINLANYMMEIEKAK